MLQQQPIYEATGISQHAMFVWTQRGVAVVKRLSAPLATAILLISYCGVQQFARFLGGSLITEDGETIEGDVLMWFMKTLLTSVCINQQGAVQLNSETSSTPAQKIAENKQKA